MHETAELYRTRLAGYVEAKNPLAMQREAAGMIARLIEGVANAKLKNRPQQGKWSVTEMLMHLADDELGTDHPRPRITSNRSTLWIQREKRTLPGRVAGAGENTE